MIAYRLLLQADFTCKRVIMNPTILKSQYPNLNKFNYHSRPLSSLSLIEKIFNNLAQNSQTSIKKTTPQLISFEISHHGKSGVFFLETQQGSFVLKCCHETPQDYFASSFAIMLEINTPQVQILNCGERQFHDIVYAIESFCEKDQCLLRIVKNRLDFPFYQIMQYIPSIGLANMAADKFKAYIDQSLITHNKIQDSYGNYQSQNQSVSLSPMSNQKLYEIGKCLGFDIIINNADRFKFIWNTQGNVNNILISVDVQTKQQLQLLKDRKFYQKQNKNLRSPAKIVFIDHSPCLPDQNNKIAKANIQKYFDKVCAFHLENIAFLRKQRQDLPNVYNKLNQQIQFFCQYNFTTDEQVMIAQGIVYVTDNFIKQFQLGNIKTLYDSMFRQADSKKLSELFKSKKMQKEDLSQISFTEMAYWNGFWNQQLQKINISFLESIYVKLQSIYSTYPQLIEQIRRKVQNSIQQNRSNHQKISSKVISKVPSQIMRNKSKLNEKSSDLEQSDKDFIKQDDPQEFRKTITLSSAQKQSQRIRKWREKLQAFKSFNYMEKQ